MPIAQSVAEVLRNHVTFELEGIDRMYLNAYVPLLQTGGFRFASAAAMAPMTKAFVAAMEDFIKAENLPVVKFRKGQRKDDTAAEYRARFTGEEGILFVGKAQEKIPTPRVASRTFA